MRVNQLSSIVTDREALFDIVTKNEPDLILGEKSDQIRNLVHKATFKGKEVFLKIGLAENLENLLEFYNHNPKFTSFCIPEILSSGHFTNGEKKFVYSIETKVAGVSLNNSHDFNLLNEKVVDIIMEIDSLPNFMLLNSEERKKQLKNPEGYIYYRDKLNKMLLFWYKNSRLKYPTILKEATSILENIDKMEWGTAHGEFNFHHIFIDNGNNISIIDWERFSQTTLRYFDLQEYLGRLIVFEGQFKDVEKIMSEFKSKTNFDGQSFKYSLFHRILGSLYEATVDSLPINVAVRQEGELINFVEKICQQ